MIDVFKEPDAWNGGYIELLLWFDSASEVSPASVSEIAWAWPFLSGPVISSLEDFSSQSRVDFRTLSSEEHCSLFGVGTLPNGATTAFASHLIMEDDGFYFTAGPPLGSLARAYPAVGAYPFRGSPTDPWAMEVYGWLANLGRCIFQQAKFASGLIGWTTTMEFDETRSGEIPSRRYHGYLTISGSQIRYLEPNVREPLMTVGRNDA